MKELTCSNCSTMERPVTPFWATMPAIAIIARRPLLISARSFACFSCWDTYLAVSPEELCEVWLRGLALTWKIAVISSHIGFANLGA